MFRKYILPLLIFWVYRLLVWSWRITVIEAPELQAFRKSGKPWVFAHWHGHELALVHLVHRYKLATMTSTSKDGQLIDSVIKRFGGATSKGSSTRGGVSALKGLIRLMKAGHPSSVAVDGPKGPIYKVKPGVFELSRMTKAPIFCTGVAVSNPFVFEKSWNKAILPRPFSRVVVVFGSVLGPVSRDEDPKSGDLANQVAQGIEIASQQARDHLES